MASKKKRKRKSLVKRIGNWILNVAWLFLILWLGLPLGLMANEFYIELFKDSPPPQKTRTLSKEVRTYYAAFQRE